MRGQPLLGESIVNCFNIVMSSQMKGSWSLRTGH